MKKTNNAPQLNIRYVSSAGQVMIVPLGERDLTVGSAENADIRLTSTTISRLHLRIALRDNHVYVTDLDSRNGTFLNGLRLPPNVEHEWLPGDRLRLSETTLELVEQVLQEKKVLNELKLTADPMLVKPGQIVRLTLTTTGENQQVTLQSQSIVPGLGVQLNWQGGEVKPDVPVEIQAQIRSTQMSLTGGERRVRFVALSRSNLISTVEVTVRLRKKLETLLLLLLLLTGCSAASLAAIVVVPRVLALINPPPPDQLEVSNSPSEPTAVAVALPTVAPTTTPSPIPPTDVPTVVTPPSVTPTDTPIVTVSTPCPTGTTLTHTVKPGETLSGIAQRYNTNVDALVINNNIADPKKIFAGQRLTVTCGEYRIITPIPTTETPLCQSVKPTSPLDGLTCKSNTFFWDPAPGADHYVLNLYDEKNNKVQSITTKGNETSLTTMVDVASAGSGINFSWDVQALQNGQVICSSQPVKLPRETCEPVHVQKADLVVNNVVVAVQCSGIQNLNITYAFTVTNNGPDDATGIAITETGITTITPVEGVGRDTTGSNKDFIKVLHAGESQTFNTGSFIVPIVRQDFDYLTTITIDAQSEIADDNTANNSASVTKENVDFVNCLPPRTEEPDPTPKTDVEVSLSDDINANCLQGDPSKFQINYAYTVTNNGPIDPGSVTVITTRTLTLAVSNNSDDLTGTPTTKDYPQSTKLILGGENQIQTGNESLVVPSPLGADSNANLRFGYRIKITVTVSIDNFEDSDTSNNSSTMERVQNARTFNCRVQLG